METDIVDMEKTGEMEEAGSNQKETAMFIQPTCLQDPKLVELKEVLVDWINSTLKPEHIVVQSLEEDLYDGLVLHHLLVRLAKVQLPMVEIAVTRQSQIHKLQLVLEELNKSLGIEDGHPCNWSTKLIHNKDLLATIHLLVAMVRRFQPDLDLPANVRVEVVQVEVTQSGIKSDKQFQLLTSESDSGGGCLDGSGGEDPIEKLLKLEVHKVNTVKKAILHFVNHSLETMGLQVADMDTQFSDGVILLLLVGQLEGFYIPLCDFHLAPVNHSEMLHNMTLVMDLLRDTDLQMTGVKPQDIVSQDVTATLKVLYALFKKYKPLSEGSKTRSQS